MRNIVTIFILILFSSKSYYAQALKLKKDSLYIKNFQIEFLGEKNYLFISNEGSAEIPFNNFQQFSKINIIDLDNDVLYDLYGDELKLDDNVLYFSQGKIIEPVVINKKKEMIIGMDDKGSSYKLYIMPDVIKIVQIPIIETYKTRKIKKIKYYFEGGRHPQSGLKIQKQNTKIIPILYSCETVDCKDPKELISETEVGFAENSKYLEVDLRHKNIILDENSKYIYVGFKSLDFYVTKMKKVNKIGDNKCYNAAGQPLIYKMNMYSCPIISLILE